MQTYHRMLSALLLVTLVPLLIYFSVAMVVQKSILDNFQEVGGELLPGNIATTRIMIELYRILNLTDEYIVSTNPHDRAKIHNAIATLDVHSTTHRLFHHEVHNVLETQEINILIHRVTSFITEYLYLIDKGASQTELVQVRSKVENALDVFLTSVNPIIDREMLESSMKLKVSKQRSINVFYFYIWFGLFAIGLALALILYLYGRFRALDKENENFKNNLESLVARRTRQLNEKNIILEGEISERKKIESELRDSEKNLETVLDSSIPICFTSLDYEILTANQSYRDIWNVSKGDDKTLLKCFESRPGPLCHSELCPLQQVKDGETKLVVEVQRVGKDGQLRDFIVTSKPFYDNTGKLIGIVESFQEITARKKAEAEKLRLEKELRVSQKMEAIGTLAGGIAHDFNNILMAISGYVQVVIKKVGNDENLIFELTQVHNASERAKELVKQILTFSSQTEQVKRPLVVAPIIKEALTLLRASIPANIEIKQAINTQWHIMADPTQIHQIVMNLVTNAYHSIMGTGGVVGVSLHEVVISDSDEMSELQIIPGKYICLEVSDNGSGMDEETKSKIFEPYFTTKDIDKGTGLGLAVVHGIVTGHHGYIMVTSALGKGTTFYIYLPMIEEVSTLEVVSVDVGPVRGGHERIMIIDDEELLAYLESLVLEDMYGYVTTPFTSATLAMEEFCQQPDDFDLIITDMAMPQMTGLDVAQKIKEIRPDKPIILCSGFSKTLNESKALAMGIDRYIQKPVSMDDLARIVRDLLDMKQ